MLELIIGLISGAVGGNVAARGLKDYDLGTLWNSVAGIVGGGIGASVLNSVLGGAVDANSAGGIGDIIGSVASGGIGGGLLLVVVGLIKNAMNKG